MTSKEILSHIRNVPDFPKKGILFKDITTALKEPKVFKSIINKISNLVKELDFDYIVAIESRGYLLGAPLAYKLNKGLIIVRKPGKLPAKVIREEYALEYGTDSLEMHADAIEKGKKALLIDDLIATGGTIKATARLVEKCGAKVVGAAFLIDLVDLSKNAKLKCPIYSLIKCKEGI